MDVEHYSESDSWCVNCGEFGSRLHSLKQPYKNCV